MANTSNLFDTNISLEPVGGIWNVTGKYISKFVRDYLEGREISGVVNVEVYIRDKGSANARVAIYAFMASNSNAVVCNSKRRDVAEGLESKLDFGSGQRLTDAGKAAFEPISRENPRFGRAKELGGVYFIELDIFSVLGLMLKAPTGKYKIWIDRMVDSADGPVISVIKQDVQGGRTSDGGNDKFERWVENAERRRYN